MNILTKLRSLNVELSLESRKLKVNAPEGVMSQALLGEIKLNKEALIKHLERVSDPAQDFSIPVAPEMEYYPLSVAQERLYFLYQLDKENVSYNMPAVFSLQGALDTIKLNSVLDQLVVRHEAFRTSFKMLDNQPVQCIHKSQPIEVQYFVLEGQDVDTILKSFIKPFDLQKSPLLRAGVVQVNSLEHLLIIDMHHIISDGVSQQVLVRDFSELYHGREPKPLKIQYKDFAVWQSNTTKKENNIEHKAYWMNQFEADTTILELPTDFKRPAVKSNRGAKKVLELNASITNGLRKIKENGNVSMFSVLFTAFNVFLHKVSNQQDITVGVPVAGRDNDDLEGIIGMFVNTLPIRTFPKPETTFIGLLKEVNQTVLSGIDHSQYTYESLVSDLNLERDLSRNPLFELLFLYQNLEDTKLQVSDLTIAPYEYQHLISKFDLTLEVQEDHDRLTVGFEYATDLFKRETIDRFMGYLLNVLEQVASDENIKITSIDVIADQERTKLLSDLNDTTASYAADRTLVDFFEKQVKATPDAVAIHFNEVKLTYRELNRRAEVICAHLHHNLDVKARDFVGVGMLRHENLLSVILGILKAGAAYLPIDPKQPVERINTIITDSGLKVMITDGRINEDLLVSNTPVVPIDSIVFDDTAEIKPVEVNFNSNDLAYVIYTSGSTGKPKGVMIEHHSVINRIAWMHKEYPVASQDVLMLKTPIVFDVSVWELFGWFFSGASLCVLPPYHEKDTEKITYAVNRYKVTGIHFVPSMLGMFLETLKNGCDYSRLDSLKYVFCTGEVLKVSHFNDFRAYLHQQIGVRLINLYGPTEATVEVSHYECLFDRDYDSIPIGVPMDNTQLYVLDENQNLVPEGTIGELYIAGVALARGYLNNEELTNEKFIPNPFDSSTRVYKTGDLAYWNADGNIEYKGRIDHQVKIRGYRIELGDIEVHLNSYDTISEVVVTVYEQGEEQSLVAYYVSDEPIDSLLLVQYLEERLPNYMVPAYFMHLKEIQLTTSGKVNRKALPTPRYEVVDQFIQPINETETKLTEIWAEVLKIKATEISTNTSFFQIGGNSLRATALSNKIQSVFNLDFPITVVFDHQKIADQHKFIVAAQSTQYLPLTQADKKDFYPLSPQQQRLYFLYQLNIDSLVYNLPQAFILNGKLDRELLKAAFEKIVASNESLRTSFHLVDGLPVQRIHDDIDFEIEWLTSSENELGSTINSFVAPFDLSQAPLFRVGVIATGKESHVLVVDMHHIVSDGVSQNVLMEQFAAIYGKHSSISTGFQYKDYVNWLGQPAQQTKINEDRVFWLAQYAEKPTMLDLPTDFTRPLDRKHTGNHQKFTITTRETSQLRRLANDEDTTMFMLLFAVFNVFLSKLSYTKDIVVGVPTAGRQNTDLDHIIGLFVNTLPIRSHVSGDMLFKDLLRNTRSNTLNCFRHQGMQFDQLIEELNAERHSNRNPLFDVIFSYENFIENELLIPGMEVKPYPVRSDTSKVDLTFQVTENKDDLTVTLEYSTELFTSETIEKFIGYFKNLLNHLTENSNLLIKDTSLLSSTDKNNLLRIAQGPTLSIHEGTTLVSLFEQNVAKYPNDIAAVDGTRSVTFGELNTKANQIARAIKEKLNGRTGQKVALIFSSGIEVTASMLGVLKSGNAYIPLTPDYPQERIDYILADCAVDVIVSSAAFHKENGVPVFERNVEYIWVDNTYTQESITTNLNVEVVPEDSAYIIYTSGTTGKPKGVDVKHQGIVNTVFNYDKLFHLGRGVAMSQAANITFDATAIETWPCISYGGVLHFAPEIERQDPDAMAQWLTENKIEITFQATAIAEYLLEKDWSGYNHSLRVMNIGGDKLMHYPENELPFELNNLYGPTEDSVFTTWTKISEGKKPSYYSIGRPMSNKEVYILDEYHNLQPKGVIGELCISGRGLARGYVNNPAQTRTSFIENPFKRDQMIYKTGDFARWLPDNTIEFLGRADSQVKIRGYRIELGEIENQLTSLDDLDTALIRVIGEEGNKQLVAYFVSKKELGNEYFRNALAKKLPAYMVPSYFIQLDQIPMTNHGKIDWKALPQPKRRSCENRQLASNDVEKKLVDIWSYVLEIPAEEIDLNLSFFESGGTSINIIKLRHEITEEFEIAISVAEMFRLTSIVEMAAYIMNEEENDSEEIMNDIDESLLEVEDNIDLINQLEDY